MSDATNTIAPSPQHSSGSAMALFYYGLVVVVTAALILLAYNLVVLKCCVNGPSQQRVTRQLPTWGSTTRPRTHDAENSGTLLSFKYKKEEVNQEQVTCRECVVCLSVFEDGEDVKQMPRCKHSFHAPCIDMWLYSHFDCPLCRAPVDRLLQRRNFAAGLAEF
ncbi:hypothetical protein Nepgr_015591 [Nepenthes gracilis]|uniref:RING-type E3 ubiquitin transferase n=1 Tax=Nepenthes gracilis TaxID=150966 RepID=A0AAD3SN45_NEPGR|nr:hypothetical protein Nepgr_015591 [Nepenthes gracilis]